MPYNFVRDSFNTGVTAEALLAKIDGKSVISLQRGHFHPNLQVQNVAPYQSFLHGLLGQWMPYNFAADSFHTKNFVADFLQAKCDFTRKSAVLRFWDPLWETYGPRTTIILGSLESA